MSNRSKTTQCLYPAPEPAFGRDEYDSRIERVRRRMAEDRIDCLFVSAPEGMFYLCGYRSAFMQGQNPKQWPPTSGVAVHVDHDRIILFDTARETVMHRAYVEADDVRLFPPGPTRDGTEFIADQLSQEGWLRGSVGLEFWSYRPNRAISERFESHLKAHGAEVIDGSDVLREVRWLKSKAELRCIEEAASIGCAGLEAARAAIGAGVSELEVLGEALAAMSREGGEVPAVIPPVLSGEKTAAPHSLATTRRMNQDEPVLIDLAGVRHRYHANLARTWWIGPPPASAVNISQRAADSLKVLRDVMKPGISSAEIARELIRYYDEVRLWPHRSWIGGYEMGVAFPPAWTGNYVFDPASDIGREQIFEPGIAINFENQFFLPNHQGMYFMIDTVILDDAGARLLSERVPYILENAD